MSAGDHRRGDDVITALLTDRIDAVENDGKETRKALAKHVSECAAMQRKVMWGVIAVLGYTVAHGPEARAIAEMFMKAVHP